MDRAIRALGEKATDPFQLGMVALYAKNYPEATKHLAAAVTERKRRAEQANHELADAKFFLGRSLVEQGRYREAIPAFQEASALQPDNVFLLQLSALGYKIEGKYSEAELAYKRVLAIEEKQPGPGTHS